ncbi:MAG: GNAT family N-acetyltransferase [Kangiellaceae bacterium]|nr:GNAT family N-acetyltransferase [Kangiellaceae bacterium]MCW8998939.1 GNAT family N-acetyltransferase [Kangiellaceae bacterium]MCW9016688.1 GNAT family N-acetyltransferase [Kangiellaceae bacterium]
MSKPSITEHNFSIDSMQPNDFPRMMEIYQQALDSKNATFQTQLPNWNDWNKNHLKSPRLVYQKTGNALGWCALSPTSSRYCYRGVAEVSIYIDSNAQGMGIGSQLMCQLVEKAKAQGVWTLQSAIFPENTASVKMHEKTGFRLVGYRERIGQLAGLWRDSWLYELRF